MEKGGRSGLDIRPLLWTPDGWPLPGANVREGTYQIRSQRTGSVLQSSTNLLQTARYLVRDHQKWNVAPARGGFCKITGAGGENALAAADGTVALAPFTGTDLQLWKIDQLGDGSYRVASKGNQLALTATFRVQPGNGIALQPFSGHDSQCWVLTAP